MTEERLEGFPVVVEIPVLWGDMDAFQHVNNVTYFRYFESARIAYFERIGALEFMKEKGFNLTQEPGPGSRGTMIFFVHPKDFSYLIEVVQETESHA